MKKTLPVVGALLLAWLIGSYALPKLLHLASPNSYIIFGALALIGILAAAIVVWWRHRQSAASDGGAAAAPADAGDELAQLLRDAEAKLAAATQLKGKPHFGQFPAVFLVGPQGTTKTTLVVNSGLEAELLAGQVYAEGGIAPTTLANIWLARNAIFLEPASAVLIDKNRWSALIKRMQPGKLRSAVKGGGQAPRAAVVMIDCEKLYGSGAVTTARDLRTQLSEISVQLGIALPVYVLFTKADRIPFFLDYVHTLDDAEGAQVLGCSLPLPAAGSKGVYAEEQTLRLNDAFDALYHSLADHRLDVLPRENDLERLPGTYEFPREMRKLRAPISQFLVELCRPSQLNAAPFLRGFYFTGVRPVFTREAISAARPNIAPVSPGVAGATGIFRPGFVQNVPEQPVTGRKVPQWVFLRPLFPDVVLADDTALSASGSSVKVSGLRRALLGTATVLSFGLLLAFTISFFKNHALETEVRDAAAAIGPVEVSQTDLPTLAALQHLDQLRGYVATLANQKREGAPLSYRWGLYIGNDLLPGARRIYFARFKQLLFAATQGSLLQNLRSLHGKSAGTDSYGYPYASLKAYLITTTEWKRSTVPYLAPLLAKRWQANRDIDADRVKLARQQFDFYAEELAYENPYDSNGDQKTIEQAQDYLNQFAGEERVYTNIRNDASHSNPLINFNQTYKGSDAVVINRTDVSGAFTKPGFTFFADAFKHLDRYIKGEPWVLGTKPAPGFEHPDVILASLKARYYREYIEAWREYLRKGAVVRYASLADAAQKLGTNTASDSPMLLMLCLASVNTGVDPEIAKAFGPLQKVEPSPCNDLIGDGNREYMKNLVQLQNALGSVTPGADPATDPNILNASKAAQDSKIAVQTLAQNLGNDAEGKIQKTIADFLEQPITYIDPLVKNLGPKALNEKGKGLCSEMSSLFGKYPFDPKSTTQASIADVNNVFKPGDGLIWKFYDANLSKFLTKTGESTSSGGVTISPRFLAFFKNALNFSNAAYKDNGTEPKIPFSLTLGNGDQLTSVLLKMNGQAAEFSSTAMGPKTFFWPGTSPQVVMSGKHSRGDVINPFSYDGVWAISVFFNDANVSPTTANGTYEWHVTFGNLKRQVMTSNGQPLLVKFDLNMGPSPAVFQKGYFSGLRCVAEIAKP